MTAARSSIIGGAGLAFGRLGFHRARGMALREFLQYTILGLVTGGVYGIAASGLVVTYTTSGIFNFAHGATAMLGAFLYWQVRFGWGWPAPVAPLFVLGFAAPLLGAVLHMA